jgi:hypothetical protein
MSSPVLQLNMFGPPESVDSYPEDARYRDDAPVPCERENLGPRDLVQRLGAELLEQLYGDVPRRTRLTVQEVCRRLRCGHTHVYDLIDVGSLDALDDRHPTATRPNYGIYRYSLVRFLFSREFIQNCTRCNLPAEDMQRIGNAVEVLRLTAVAE